jgi:UMF1 family MFS transporter
VSGGPPTGGVRAALSKLGLDSRENVSWAMYDWANSAFATTVVAAVFPIYYETTIAGDLPSNLASVYFGYTTAAALALVAVLSPVLGAIADHYRAKKRLLAAFAGLGVVATGGLFFTGPGDVLPASGLFLVANVGFVGANVFYDSLLGHVAGDDASPDRLSAAGYALGYLGGGVLLVANLAWILSPGTFGLGSQGFATRVALLSVAVWWALFSIPLLRNVSEPEPEGEREAVGGGPVRTGFARLRRTAGQVRQYRQAALFLVAFLLYADGIGTIIRMASIYGSSIGISQTGIVGALVLVQFLGIPFAFLFGSLPDRPGFTTKRALYLGLAVYTGIAVGGYFMTAEWQFWALAIAVATVQGGTQALSRSLYSSLVPKDQSSEFFSFFSISSKFAGIAGPALFALVTQVTGSSRLSIVSLLVFFVGGAAVLSLVDVEEGRRVAREAERAAADAGEGKGTGGAVADP